MAFVETIKIYSSHKPKTIYNDICSYKNVKYIQVPSSWLSFETFVFVHFLMVASLKRLKLYKKILETSSKPCMAAIRATEFVDNVCSLTFQRLGKIISKYIISTKGPGAGCTKPV